MGNKACRNRQDDGSIFSRRWGAERPVSKSVAEFNPQEMTADTPGWMREDFTPGKDAQNRILQFSLSYKKL